MKFNKWTLGLAALGVVSMASAVRADESKPSPLQTALSNTTISGYVSASANVGLTGNYYGSPAAAIPFQSGKENGFNLDVVKLVISKPEDATPWASGYEIDLLFGPDATDYNPSVNSAYYDYYGNSDFSIKQAFVTLNAPVGNGIDFKLGVFDSPLGYEVFDSGSNPNYTRSWGYAIEPTELTGLEASYKVNDMVSLNGGIADTSAAGINNRNDNEGLVKSAWHEAYFGDVTLTAPASWGWAAGSTAFAGILYGPVDTLVTGSDDGSRGGNQVNYYGGITLNTPWKQITGGLAFDYAQNYGGGYDFSVEGVGYSESVNIMAFGLYTTYKATDKLSFSGRAEYVESDGAGHNPGNYYYYDSGSQNLVEITGTVEYDLWANVQTRVEARWDQNLSTSEGLLFGDNERDSVGLYANVIYKF